MHMSKEGAVAAGAGAKGVVPVVHSAYILEHFGTFWNNLELSRTFWNILDVLEGRTGCPTKNYTLF